MMRVLHIGNIANNAYNNARSQNDAGIQADVLCSDYYHIMGCPEWEEVDFTEDIADHFFPQWPEKDMKGYKRPAWFAQGRFISCVNYLIAYRRGNRWAAEFWWRIMAEERKSRKFQVFMYDLAFIHPKHYRLVLSKLRYYLHSKYHFQIPQVSITGWLKRILPTSMKRFLRRQYQNSSYLRQMHRVAVGRMKRILPESVRHFLRLLSQMSTYVQILRAIYRFVIRWAKRILLRPLKGLLRSLYHTAAIDKIREGHSLYITPTSKDTEYFEYLVRLFAEIYPERADKLTLDDIAIYSSKFQSFKRLFEYYDVIHAYSVDPIYPMLLNNHPYVAFEHGTIREIPFQDNAQGRLTALAYYLADRVIITNSDNVEAANKMKLTNYEFIPHPMNERWNIIGIGKELRTQLEQQLNAQFLIFHPARHDWNRDTTRDLKGNHCLLEGFAQFIRDVNPSAKAILVEWGNSVKDSKALIADLHLESYIHWIAPMNRSNMARYMDACDVIADQFRLGAFGGIPPQAMSLGKPTLAYFDETVHQWCYTEMPPFINVQSADEIGAALKRLYGDKSWSNEISQRGQDWYARYHSNAIVTKRTLQIYDDLLTHKRSFNRLTPNYLTENTE